jgi:hypothetical protein
MDQDAYDALLQRLTALEAKTDARLAELKACNRDQRAINQRPQAPDEGQAPLAEG